MAKLSGQNDPLHVSKDELLHYADKNFVWNLVLKAASILCILYIVINPYIIEHYVNDNLSEVKKQNDMIANDLHTTTGKLEQIYNSLQKQETPRKLQAPTIQK